jgi:hypothetical protein
MAEVRYPTIIISAKDEMTPVLKKAGMAAISFADEVRNALNAQADSHRRAQEQAARNAGISVAEYKKRGKEFVEGGKQMQQSGLGLAAMFGRLLPGAIGRTVQTLGSAFLGFKSVEQAANSAYSSFVKFAEFDSQMRDLKFSADIGHKEMDKLADSIKAIGRISATEASKIGTAYDVLSKRSKWAHEEVMKALPDVARYAAALKMAPEQLADSYGDLARNLNIPVEKTREALEILFAARSKLGVEIDKVDLSELTSDAAKFGYQGKQGLIQYMTMLASLNDTFGDTKKSVQALRGFMDEMISDRVSTAMRGWGGALKQEFREVVKSGGDVNAWWANILSELVNRQDVLDAMGKDSGRVAENFLKMLEGGMLSKQRILEAASKSTAGYDAGTEQLKTANAELKRMQENLDQLAKQFGSLLDAFGATAALSQLNSWLEKIRRNMSFMDKAWRWAIEGGEWPRLFTDEEIKAMKDNEWFIEGFPGGGILRRRIERFTKEQSKPAEGPEEREELPLERPLPPSQQAPYGRPPLRGGGPGAPRVGPYGYYQPSSYGSSSDSAWLPADFRGRGFQNVMFGRGGGPVTGGGAFERGGPAGGYGGGSAYGGGGGRPIPAAPGGHAPRAREGGREGGAAASGAPAGENERDAINRVAADLGVSPQDLATVMSYETGGTMSPSKWGGRGGNYLGMIQFGPAERQKYGVHPGQTAAQQIDAAGRFLKDRGLQRWLRENPNATDEEKQTALYSTINAGSPGRQYWGRSDRPGYNVQSHARAMFAPGSRHVARARGYLGLGGDGAAAAAPRPAERSSDVVAPRSEDAGGRTLFPRTASGALHRTEAGMDPELRARLLAMQADSPYGGAGLQGPRSGHRTYQEQVDIYRTSRPGYAARPGTSRHGHGEAGDLRYASAAERRWYHENAARYGITFPMGHEPWHAQKAPGYRGPAYAGRRGAAAAAAGPRPTQAMPPVADDAGGGTSTVTDFGGRRRDRPPQGFDPARRRGDDQPPPPPPPQEDGARRLYDPEHGWIIGTGGAHPNDPMTIPGGNYPQFRRSENVSDERYNDPIRGYGQRRLGQKIGINAEYNKGAAEHVRQPIGPAGPLGRALGTNELDDARFEKLYGVGGKQSMNMNINVNAAQVQFARRGIENQLYGAQNRVAATTYYDSTTS